MTSPSGSTAAGQAVAGDDGRGGSATSSAHHAGAVTSKNLPEVAVRPGPGKHAAAGDQRGPAWMRYAPPVVAFLLGIWGITTPSFWRDEAATIAAVSRPYPDMIRMLGNVDAVHALYYTLMWPLVHLFGAGELVLRLPSTIAAAVAAAALAAIGRRLLGPWPGFTAGIVLAVLPVTTRYAQEGRSYEMVVAVATIACYLLIRVLQAEPGQRRRWVIGYGASIAALGVLNIFGLLLVPAHAVTMALYWRRHPRDEGARRLALGWLLAAGAGVVIASPLLVLGWMQRAQIAWLSQNKTSSGINTVFALPGSYLVATAVITVVAIALVFGMERSRQERQQSWTRQLIELSVPWLVVPPFILFAASVVHPVYTSRYILMCIPALALIVAAAISTFGQAAGTTAIAVILLAGATAQFADRGPAGHFDDIRGVDNVVATLSRPGDAVLYTNPNAESFGDAYSYGLRKLTNIGIKQAAIPSGTLAGSPASLAEIRSRLLHVNRVWVVEINTFDANPDLDSLQGSPVGSIFTGLPFSFTNVWQEHGDYLLLFTRS
jgi:mannosyltransferase